MVNKNISHICQARWQPWDLHTSGAQDSAMQRISPKDSVAWLTTVEHFLLGENWSFFGGIIQVLDFGAADILRRKKSFRHGNNFLSVVNWITDAKGSQLQVCMWEKKEESKISLIYICQNDFSAKSDNVVRTLWLWPINLEFTILSVRCTLGLQPFQYRVLLCFVCFSRQDFFV